MVKTAEANPGDMLASPQQAMELPWRMVLENTIVGVALLVNRRFVWANARMAEIFGYEPGELDGQSVRRLYVTQEDFEEVGHAYARCERPDGYSHDHAQVRKNGDVIWCRAAGRMIEPGNPDSMSVWVVQDLSDKKQAEDELRRVNQKLEQMVLRRTLNLRRTNEALRAEIDRRRQAQAVSTESRDKYRALFGHMPLGVLVTNASGDIIEINRMLQTSLCAGTRPILDRLIEDATRVIGSDGQPTSLAAMVRAYPLENGSRPVRFEFRWLAGNGTWRDIAAVAMPLATRSLGAVFTFSDVTEQRLSREREHKQREELARASRLSLMGQIASALAHELGQPLNATQSYLSGIRHRLGDELADRPELAEALDKAMAHLEQAGQIISNVRGFVSRHEPEYRATQLPDLLAHTLQLLELPLRDGKVSVKPMFDEAAGEPLPAAHCNPVEVQQVFVNLILNSIDALQVNAPRDRHVDIRISRHAPSMLSVAVSDNGPGVAADVAGRLFEPYVTNKASGLGMGLMICRTIVESHGGTLKLDSSSGPGACFRFSLPTASAKP